MAQVLQDIRVIDLTQALAGPYCTMMLGDLGADVIKIERPGAGDDTRRWGPPNIGGESAYYLCANRNKRSLTVNLKVPEGQGMLPLCTETISKLGGSLLALLTWGREEPGERTVTVRASGVDAEKLKEGIAKLGVEFVMDYVVAYQMLHRSVNLESGDRVFIHGASGGCGTALLQLGTLMGLRLFLLLETTP